jgi:hypothetical protein
MARCRRSAVEALQRILSDPALSAREVTQATRALAALEVHGPAPSVRKLEAMADRLARVKD